MSKNIRQTKKAKEEFYSPLIKHLKTLKTKEEISSILCLSERKSRDEVNTVRKYYAVISGSFQKGYRIARKIQEMTFEEKLIEQQLVERTIAEFQSRIKDMKKNMKPLIAYSKTLEKNIDKEVLKRKDKEIDQINNEIDEMQNKK